MALVVADRVKETTTTTGTGTYTLAGAQTGFESFSVVGNGNTTYYCCTDGTDFEVGIGTYTASGTTLARTTILQSSNSDAAVNWTSGTRDIFVTQPAEKAVFLDGSGDVSIPGQIKLSKTSGIAIETTGNLGNADLTLLSANSGTSGQYGFDIIYKGTRSGNANSFALNMHNQTSTDVEAITVYQDGKVGINNTAPTAPLDVTGNIVVSGTVDGRDVATDGTKLDGIEASADVTDTANVTAAGALMDSEVTNLAQVKAFDSSDYATAAQGSTADSAMQDLSDDTTPQLGGVLDTNGNNIEFGDSTGAEVERLKFGAGDDLQIYHDGSNTYIDEAGTGNLYIRAGGTNNISLTDNGTYLYYGGNSKLQTTTDGVDIISTDAGNTIGPKLHLYRDSASPADFDDLGGLVFTGNNSVGDRHEYSLIRSEVADVTDGSEDAYIQFFTNVGGSSLQHMSLAFGATSITGQLYLAGNTIHSNPHIQFEGSTADNFETSLYAADPTADRTITLPDATGTVLTTGNSDTPTTTTSSSDADFVLVDDGGTMKKITPANLGVPSDLDFGLITGSAASTADYGAIT